MITWNRCADIMPNTVGEYLVVFESFGYQNIEIAYIEDDVFMVLGSNDEYCEVQEPTHWSELNKPLGVVTCTNNIHWEM